MDPHEVTFELGSKEHADAILRAVDGRNDLVHAMFRYGCRTCRHVEDIYLGVGVEGPLKLREQNLYIPSPFGGPGCVYCGGETSHINWQQDKHFAPIDPPPGVRYFRVPPQGVDMRTFQGSCFCGDTVRAPGGEPLGGWMRPRSPRAG